MRCGIHALLLVTHTQRDPEGTFRTADFTTAPEAHLDHVLNTLQDLVYTLNSQRCVGHHVQSTCQDTYTTNFRCHQEIAD